MATPGVGEDIEDICLRCGDTWHVVMAKVGDRVVKVVCKRCGGQHDYRGDYSEEPARPRKKQWGRPRRRRPRRAAPAPAVAQFDPSKPPRSYSPQGSYLPGERLIHVSFGVGVVTSLPGPGKVDVQFPGGVRTLACVKTGPALARPIAVANPALPDCPTPKAGSGR